MTDIDELLRADATRWRDDARPPLDLDDQVHAALAERPRRRFVLPVLAAAAVVLAAAIVVAVRVAANRDNRPAAPDLSAITGVSWQDPHSAGVVVYTDATMRFDDECSGGLARLIVDHGALREGKRYYWNACGGTTADGPAVSAAERRLEHFYAVVAGPAAWSRAGNILTLSTPGKGTLHLVAGSRPIELVGRTWRLIDYNGTDGYEHVAPTQFRFTVGSDGRFVVATSCGPLRGKADVTPTTIVFHDVVSSYQGCPLGFDAASKVIVAMMANSRAPHFYIGGIQLVVSDRAGRMLVFQT